MKKKFLVLMLFSLASKTSLAWGPFGHKKNPEGTIKLKVKKTTGEKSRSQIAYLEYADKFVSGVTISLATKFLNCLQQSYDSEQCSKKRTKLNEEMFVFAEFIIDNLMEQCAKIDKEIASFKSQRSWLDGRIAYFKKQRSCVAGSGSDLEEQCSWLDGRIAEIEKQRSRLERSWLDGRGSDLAKQCTVLNKQLASFEKIKNEVLQRFEGNEPFSTKKQYSSARARVSKKLSNSGLLAPYPDKDLSSLDLTPTQPVT